MTRVCKGADLGLVAGDGGWERLLGLAIDEFAKVESSVSLSVEHYGIYVRAVAGIRLSSLFEVSDLVG